MGNNEYEAIFLTVLGSVLPPKSALYAAGPLEHGKLYYESLGQPTVTGADVRAINQQKLTEFVAELRIRRFAPVIDPGLLQVSTWDARTIGNFFLEVINRFVKEAWFIDGWEFSHGATKEFMHCFRQDLPCFDERGNRLTLKEAAELTRSAIDYLNNLGLPPGKLVERLQMFENEIKA